MQTGYISSPVKTFINRRQHRGLREEEGVQVNIPPPTPPARPTLIQEKSLLLFFQQSVVLCSTR